MQKKVTRAISPICGMAFCPNCKRVEIVRDAGPFFYQCDECVGTIPKQLHSSTVTYESAFGAVED